MTDATVVAERVRAFAAQVRPGQADVAARAAATAVRALVGGASVHEACAAGRRAVRRAAPRRAPLDLAS